MRSKNTFLYYSHHFCANCVVIVVTLYSTAERLQSGQQRGSAGRLGTAAECATVWALDHSLPSGASAFRLEPCGHMCNGNNYTLQYYHYKPFKAMTLPEKVFK